MNEPNSCAVNRPSDFHRFTRRNRDREKVAAGKGREQQIISVIRNLAKRSFNDGNEKLRLQLQTAFDVFR